MAQKFNDSKYFAIYGIQGLIYKDVFFFQYMKSHCGEKGILQPSYLYNGISYTWFSYLGDTLP